MVVEALAAGTCGTDAEIASGSYTVSPGGIICLTGVGSPAVPDTASATTLATDVVLKNIAVFGSVNANRRHYYRAAKVPTGLVRFPDGKVQHDRGPSRRAPGSPSGG